MPVAEVGNIFSCFLPHTGIQMGRWTKVILPCCAYLAVPHRDVTLFPYHAERLASFTYYTSVNQAVKYAEALWEKEMAINHNSSHQWKLLTISITGRGGKDHLPFLPARQVFMCMDREPWKESG